MLIVCFVANFGTLSKRNALSGYDDSVPEDDSGTSLWSLLKFNLFGNKFEFASQTGVEILSNTNKTELPKASTMTRSSMGTKMLFMNTTMNLKYGTGPISIGYTTPPKLFNGYPTLRIGNTPKAIGRRAEKCSSALMR